jgi:hypothetical protein
MKQSSLADYSKTGPNFIVSLDSFIQKENSLVYKMI